MSDDIQSQHFWGLRNKLIIILLLMTIIPLLIFSVISTRFMVNNVRENFKNTTSLGVQQIEHTFELYRSNLITLSEIIANDKNIQNMNNALSDYRNKVPDESGKIPMIYNNFSSAEKNIYDQLEIFIKSNKLGLLEAYVASESNGGYVQYPVTPRSPGYDARTRSWYKQAIETRDKVVISSPMLQSNGKLTISTMKAVIKRDGNIGGVTGFSVSLDSITNLISSFRIGKTGYIILVDQNGVIVADPVKPENNFKKITEIKGSGLPDLLKSETGKIYNIRLNGKKELASIHYSSENKWYFIAVVEQSELMTSITKLYIIQLMILFIIIACVVSLSIILARNFTAPIISSGKIISSIGHGDLTGDLPANLLARKDEIGHMMNILKDMQDSISNLIANVRQAADIVVSACQNLSELTNHSGKLSNDLSSIIEEISLTANSQANDISNSAMRLNELSSQMDELVVYNEQINSKATDVSNSSQTGLDSIRELSVLANKNHSANEHAEEAMKVMLKAINQIGDITGNISEIADQTNLLALNASIEAARAGDFGKSFAVVADEVARLAIEAGQAAKNIIALSTNVRKGYEQAQNSISESMKLSDDQQKGVSRTIGIFESLDDLAKLLSTNTSQIKENYINILKQEKNINEAMSNLAAAVEETSAATSSANMTTKDQLEAFSEVTSYTGELKTLSGQLISELGHFKTK